MKSKSRFKVLVAVILVVILFGGMTYFGKSYHQDLVKGPNNHYYQRTKTFNKGKIQQNIYSQSELSQLTLVTHGSQYSGNTSLDSASTAHVYQLNGQPLPNIVGPDGVLQLYNQSGFMTSQMVVAAAKYWNKIAGKKIVEVVSKQYQSDEVIHDGQNSQAVLGGQTYNGQGIRFYPGNWRSLASLSKRNQNNWKEAALIHEIGHALGVPHLGGGILGTNANTDGISTTELMATWTVAQSNSPKQNNAGVRSTNVDAAALALAGLSWEKPQRLASWVLKTPGSYVNYDNGKIVSTIK